MNNLRLLAWLLCASVLSCGVCALGESVVTLDEIFHSAEANSAQLRPLFSSQTETEHELSEARSQRLPDINASLSVNYFGNGFTTSRNFGDYQQAPIPHLGTGLSININQPLYAGGAITGAIRLAELKNTSARFATDLRRDNIRFQLTEFYLDIYKYHNLRSVLESNISSANKVLAEMHARYEQGTALLNDVTRYELLISTLELQLEKVNNTLLILNNNLVNIAGLPETTVVIPDSTILFQALPEHSESWWQNQALANSPSLMLTRNSVDMSRSAESIVRARRLPRVALQAGWTIDGPILVEVPPINRNLSYWYVGLGISYNISSLFKVNKSIARSRAATHTAINQLEATAQEMNLKVRADYIRYLEAVNELKTREKSVELAMRNYHTISTRYSEGMALITEVLDAADTRLNAQQQLVNAKIDIIYYYYKLLFTTGKI